MLNPVPTRLILPLSLPLPAASAVPVVALRFLPIPLLVFLAIEGLMFSFPCLRSLTSTALFSCPAFCTGASGSLTSTSTSKSPSRVVARGCFLFFWVPFLNSNSNWLSLFWTEFRFISSHASVSRLMAGSALSGACLTMLFGHHAGAGFSMLVSSTDRVLLFLRSSRQSLAGRCCIARAGAGTEWSWKRVVLDEECRLCVLESWLIVVEVWCRANAQLDLKFLVLELVISHGTAFLFCNVTPGVIVVGVVGAMALLLAMVPLRRSSSSLRCA